MTPFVNFLQPITSFSLDYKNDYITNRSACQEVFWIFFDFQSAFVVRALALLTIIIIALLYQIARWNVAQISGEISLNLCALCLLTKLLAGCIMVNSAPHNRGRRVGRAQLD